MRPEWFQTKTGNVIHLTQVTNCQPGDDGAWVFWSGGGELLDELDWQQFSRYLSPPPIVSGNDGIPGDGWFPGARVPKKWTIR